MKHIFELGTEPTTLVLLHGTGGNEHDLLPLGKRIDPNANILSIRGNVLEYGMPRFFKRLAMGVFDEESLITETVHLYEFIEQAAKMYQFDRNKIVVLGYSNGANIASSVLLHYDHPFSGAILLHPMVPIRHVEPTNLKQLRVIITAGRQDQMVKVEETEELKHMFEARGAHVEIYYTNQGHQLVKEELEAVKHWYDDIK